MLYILYLILSFYFTPGHTKKIMSGDCNNVFYNFPITNDLIQVVDFPTRILEFESHSTALLDLCTDTSICSVFALPPLGNSDHVVLSVRSFSFYTF